MPPILADMRYKDFKPVHADLDSVRFPLVLYANGEYSSNKLYGELMDSGHRSLGVLLIVVWTAKLVRSCLKSRGEL